MEDQNKASYSNQNPGFQAQLLPLRHTDIPTISTLNGSGGVPPTKVRKRREEKQRRDGMVARLPGAPGFCVAPQRMLGQAGAWWSMNHGCLLRR